MTTRIYRKYFINVYVYKRKNKNICNGCHKLQKNKYGYFYITQYVRCQISSNIYKILNNGSIYTTLDDRERIFQEWKDIAIASFSNKIDIEECSDSMIRVVEPYLCELLYEKEIKLNNKRVEKHNSNSSVDIKELQLLSKTIDISNDHVFNF